MAVWSVHQFYLRYESGIPAETRRELFDKQDEVDARREEMIEAIEQRLLKNLEEQRLFTVQWRVI